MGDFLSEEVFLRAAGRLQKKHPDRVVLFGGVPRIPTDRMVAAGARLLQSNQDDSSWKLARLVWEAMQTASDDERTYRG